MRLSIGEARLNDSLLPPTRKESVPALAPVTPAGRLNPNQDILVVIACMVNVPPDTGASTIPAPAACASAATSRPTCTSRVVESMHSVFDASAGDKERIVGTMPLESIYTWRT